MKLAAVICFLALFASATATANSEFEFEHWKLKYEKNYASTDEHNSRFAVWKDNKNFVDAHNAKAANGDFSFTLEMNAHADMTNEEYRKSPLLAVKGSLNALPATDSYTPIEDAPAAWDWRNTKNIVNPIKNQGQCGSCWAFSAVATMEGAVNKKKGSLTSFSEQQVVDCCNGGANTCSVGGQMYQGVEYGIKNGMELESSYPYTGTSGGGCKYSASKVASKDVAGYTNVTSGDEDALKSAAYTQPIVSVGIDASSIFFQLYSTGVYDDTIFCKSDANDLDHGVAVVGYGTDSKSKKDYWIVRNSWGTTWGQQGYIWMVRNKKNQCGVATQACFATV
jgi:cathepsin L